MSGPDRNPMRGQTPKFDRDAVDRAYDRARNELAGSLDLNTGVYTASDGSLWDFHTQQRLSGPCRERARALAAQPGLFEE